MTRTACPRAHGSADAKIKSCERELRNHKIGVPLRCHSSGLAASNAAHVTRPRQIMFDADS